MRNQTGSVSKAFRIATLIVLLATTSSAVANEQTPEPFALKDGDRVVLLGGTFIERAQRYGWLETALQLRFPKANFTVRNLGWSGDTVFAESRGIFDSPAKGYERMLAQVRELKPTVIFLNYGANAAFNGSEHLDDFLQQYEKLIDDLKPTDATIILLGPLPIINRPAPLPSPVMPNRTREEFSRAISRLAARKVLRFVDMIEALEGFVDLSVNPFTGQINSVDGVTLTDAGNQAVAHLLVNSLFTAPSYRVLTVNLRAPFAAKFSSKPDDEEPVSLGVATEQLRNGIRLTLDLRASGYANGQVVIEPRGSIGRGLEFYVDGVARRPVMEPGQRLDVLSLVEPLRQTIIEKNQMYFHSWRPQNVTYLFLFRKHEQGNNAKEVEELKAIVSKLEQRVFDLKRKSDKVTVEIIRVSGKHKKQ